MILKRKERCACKFFLLSAAAKLLTQPEVTVTNGRIQMDGALLVEVVIPPPGGTEKLKTNYLKKASPAIPALCRDARDWD